MTRYYDRRRKLTSVGGCELKFNLSSYSISRFKNAVLFWRWLAGNAKSQKYDRLTEITCGLGVTRNMRAMAYLLSQLWIEQSMLQGEMLILLDSPQFDRDSA